MALLQQNLPQTPSAPERLPNSVPEGPLAPQAALTLTLLAAGTVLLFYTGCLLALLTTASLILGCLILMIGSSRLGLIGVFRGPLEALGQLASCITRSLSLKPGVRCEMPLKPEQAPRLFEVVAETARRMNVPPPDEIVLEMTDNAWVQLRGYRSGRGFCRLGLGYDLLAILSQGELTSVLAHEMAHARLIQRGSQGWLRRGVGRVCQTADAAHILARRGAKGERFFLAEIVAAGSGRLARRGISLLAAVSRHEEFAADREAALLCGSALYARTLTRICQDGSGGAPTWRDRLVAFQREGSLTEWLRARRLPQAQSKAPVHSEAAEVRQDYSTHPLLADRLVALPAATEQESSTAEHPAIDLLRQPDELAGALIAEIARITQKEEKRDSLRLHREVRRERKRTHRTPGEVAGLTLAAVSGVLMVIGAFSLVFAVSIQVPHWQMSKEMVEALYFVVPATLGLSLGSGLMWVFRFREKAALPIPSLATWTEALDARDLSRESLSVQMRARQEMEQTLRGQLPSSLRRRGEIALFWAREAYESLEACRFVQAEAAARLALESDEDLLEARVADGITSAYFGDGTGVNRSLGKVLKEFGATPSVSWGLGWALLMLGDWDQAEAYLQEALRSRPDQAVLRSLCGLSQWRQGKIHEATESIRQGLRQASPADIFAHRLLLAQVLLASGHPREAERELDALGAPQAEHPIRLAGRVQSALLLGETQEANCWAEAFEAAHPTAKTRLRLADLFAEAGEDLRANELRAQVTASGFYPEALLGQAHAAWKLGDSGQARVLLLSALDMTCPTGPHGVGALDMMENILRGLLALNGTVCLCKEWTAAIALPSPVPGMNRLTLRVAALTPEDAAKLVGEVYAAMRPGQDLSGTGIEWQSTSGLSAEEKRPGVCAWQFT